MQDEYVFEKLNETRFYIMVVVESGLFIWIDNLQATSVERNAGS